MPQDPTLFPHLDVAYSTQRVPVGAGTANGTVRTPSGPEFTSTGHDGLWLEPLESGSFWSGLVGASGFTATLDVAPTVDPLPLLGGGFPNGTPITLKV